jgi:hypothetical protein
MGASELHGDLRAARLVARIIEGMRPLCKSNIAHQRRFILARMPHRENLRHVLSKNVSELTRDQYLAAYSNRLENIEMLSVGLFLLKVASGEAFQG